MPLPPLDRDVTVCVGRGYLPRRSNVFFVQLSIIIYCPREGDAAFSHEDANEGPMRDRQVNAI